MAIDIPGWLEPVLNAYRIPWPDVDEDAFHHMKQPLHDFGQDLDAVGEAIDSALGDLESGNPSSTLGAIRFYFSKIHQDYLNPIRTICDDLSGWPCDAAYDAIVATKVTLLGLLAGEIANDVVDAVGDVLTLGLDTPAAVAEAIAVRETVSEMLYLAEGEIAGALQSRADQCIDNLVTSLITPFVNYVSQEVENAVDSYAPRILLSRAFAVEADAVNAEGGLADRLHLSPSELESCVAAIVSSSAHLDRATTSLDAAINEIFSHPAPSPHGGTVSADLRIALKSVMQTVKEDLIGAIKTLVEHVIKHFVALLEDYKRAIDDLDQQAHAIAARLHMGAMPSVAVLSAAGLGTAAAAGVVAATGVVDAEAVDSVQVEAVSAVAFTATLDPSEDEPTVTAEIVSASETTEELRVSVSGPGVSVDSTRTFVVNIDSLEVKTDVESPHVAVADSEVPQPVILSAHDFSGHVKPHADSSITEAHSQPPHLRTKHPDGRRPTTSKATSSAHGVKEIAEVKKGTRRPIVDSSPVQDGSTDQPSRK